MGMSALSWGWGPDCRDKWGVWPSLALTTDPSDKRQLQVQMGSSVGPSLTSDPRP